MLFFLFTVSFVMVTNKRVYNSAAKSLLQLNIYFK